MAAITRIVILGGGFAGTAIARRLEQQFRRDRAVEITLIDVENYFTFTPLLPEVPSGSIQPKHIVFPLREMLRKTRVIQAEVLSVDWQTRRISAAHCGACGVQQIPFDHLVLALGSRPNFFGLPGVAEHALTIKTLADATVLHAHTIDKLEHANLQGDVAAQRALLTFVVAGGGFAGVETLAELNDFVHGARKFYPNIDPAAIRMILIHSGDRILPEVSPSLSQYAQKKLTGRGVEVLLKTRVQGCTNDRVRLTSGEEIAAGTFVWAAGTSPSPIVQRVVKPNAAGRVTVDPTLAVPGVPGLWALGDSGEVPDLISGGKCPPTAQFAVRQGKVLADNLAATIRGTATKPFRFKSLGMLAGLGRRCAVAEVYGLRFSGFFAWWLWRTIYLLKLPGLERKLRVALDWTLDLFFPRDLVYLRPLHLKHGPTSHALSAAGDCEQGDCVVVRRTESAAIAAPPRDIRDSYPARVVRQ